VKVLVQIPCFNEEEQLADTVNSIRGAISTFDFDQKITWELILLDDGSTDRTLNVASELDINHVISNGINKGLAYTFQKGIENCLSLGADIIVNIDADNQYDANDIKSLIEPILNNTADMVIGDREILFSEEFSNIKKIFQIVGSWFVRRISNKNVKDAPSGFRSFSRYAASKINIYDKYTYTLENIIQASDNKLRITSVKVLTNPATRDSRLIKSNMQYIFASVYTIARTLLRYKLFHITKFLSYFFFGSSLSIYIFIFLNWSSHSQLNIKIILLISTLLLLFATHLFVFSYSCFLYNKNRKLIEDILSKQRFNNK
tara:strand:- start:4774 stop:5724 length:951 start_codon:yes stop_codon:yes gene_type:complete